MADDVDLFNLAQHPWMVDLYQELQRKDQTRNEAIREIKNSGLTELEKIVCAINIAEYKANLNHGLVNKLMNWLKRRRAKKASE